MRWMKLGLAIVAAVLAAVLAMGYWPARGGEDVGALARTARGGDLDSRHTAIVKLGRDGERGAAEVARLLQERPEPALRATCVRVLGEAYYYEAMEPLLAAMSDEDPVVRAEADAAIVRMIGATVTPTAKDPAAADEIRRQMYRTAWENLKRSPRLDSFKQRIAQQTGGSR